MPNDCTGAAPRATNEQSPYAFGDPIQKHSSQPWMTKNTPKSARSGNTTIEVIKKKIEKKKKKAASGPKKRGSSSKNDYLLTVFNPFTGPLSGIPDLVTMRSVKFRTTQRFVISTRTGATWLAFAASPSLISGLFLAGGNTSGTVLSSISVGASALTGFQPAALNNTVSTLDIAMITSTFQSLRPVAMGAKFTCTQAATSLTGAHGMRLLPSGSLPWGLETTASITGGLSASASLTGSVTAGVSIVSPVAPLSISDLMSTLDQAVNISTPLAGLWTPEDVSSTQYADVQGLIQVSGAAEFNTVQWTNATLSETDSYLMPYGITQTAVAAGLGARTFITAQIEDTPMLVYAANGIVTGSVGELELVTCWEGIPLAYAGGILGPTLSPSVPDELAQTANLIEMMPSTYLPETEADPSRCLIASVPKAAGHLYDGSDRKSAVNGSSIARALGGTAAAAAPLLGMIPGIGGLLGPGAALIGALSQNL